MRYVIFLLVIFYCTLSAVKGSSPEREPISVFQESRIWQLRQKIKFLIAHRPERQAEQYVSWIWCISEDELECIEKYCQAMLHRCISKMMTTHAQQLSFMQLPIEKVIIEEQKYTPEELQHIHLELENAIEYLLAVRYYLQRSADLLHIAPDRGSFKALVAADIQDIVNYITIEREQLLQGYSREWRNEKIFATKFNGNMLRMIWNCYHNLRKCKTLPLLSAAVSCVLVDDLYTLILQELQSNKELNALLAAGRPLQENAYYLDQIPGSVINEWGKRFIYPLLCSYIQR